MDITDLTIISNSFLGSVLFLTDLQIWEAIWDLDGYSGWGMTESTLRFKHPSKSKHSSDFEIRVRLDTPLGHFQYILWVMSHPMRWNCPRRKNKQTGIWVLFYFSLRHAENTVNFSPKSVVFLSKNNQNLQNVSDKKKNLMPEVFFPSDKAQKPLSGSVAHRIYWEWPYNVHVK